MVSIPLSHVEDSQKLVADGLIDLFEITPTSGGTLYFKPDNTMTWLGNQYLGIPCGLTGLKKSAETVSSQPRLTIGQENIDLSIFKPLVFDGHLDGAILVYKEVLLDHVIANSDIKRTMVFRVKRVEGYSRTKITLGLSTASDAMSFTLPNLQYYPPDFPAVMI